MNPQQILNRLCFGSTPGDVDTLLQKGLPAWLDEQLTPDEAKDEAVTAYLAAFRLHVEYKAGEANGKRYRPVKEERPIKWLHAGLPKLWKLVTDETKPDPEKEIPFQEFLAATWIRAVHSHWQLREQMALFWHNHFNVNVDVGDKVRTLYAYYDREVIRRHVFGNFRQLLEAMAKSVPMLFYLNNESSKASPANENFARELFELHSIGTPHYFNHLYHNWLDVPGAREGKPIGYIDHDVYETAKAFTGWTVADGREDGKGGVFPNTGEFYYHEPWHDPGEKRVLAKEIPANQPPMKDGRDVLDMIARHPATAEYLCTKLIRRLFTDQPPDSLVKKAADVWLEQVDSPNQIAQVLRTIILDPIVAETPPAKAKNPFEFAVSYLRATEAQFYPTASLTNTLEYLGYRLYTWPGPDGNPDVTNYWSSTNTILGLWNLAVEMDSEDIARMKIPSAILCPPTQTNARQLYQYWTHRLAIGALPTPVEQKLLDQLSHPGTPDTKLDPTSPETLHRTRQFVATLAMTPDFLRR